MSSADTIILSFAICAAAMVAALLILRVTRLSLGIPFAYLTLLFIEHLPGTYAHLVRPDLFDTTDAVATGVWQTAVASSCFVAGLTYARRAQFQLLTSLGSRASILWPESNGLGRRFWLFCLFGGWFFIYGLTPLRDIPSIGSLVEKGGSIWILGVTLGLRDAMARRSVRSAFRWLVALSVYPLLTLILGGFLSFGTIAAVVAVSVLTVTTRRIGLVYISVATAALLMITVFVNYFVVRDQIRAVVWSDATFTERVDAVVDALSNFDLLSFSNDKHADALNQRLNQSYFAGLAAERLASGIVEYRYAASLYEAVIAPIPRVVWPDKPVFGGSGSIVRDMTGLPLSETTSWGVGQVMEFYISYGWPSLVAGFLFLGWIIGHLDLTAAVSERRGDGRTLLACFMPAVALTQPIVSVVELSGGALAAYFVSKAWSYGWIEIRRRRSRA